MGNSKSQLRRFQRKSSFENNRSLASLPPMAFETRSIKSGTMGGGDNSRSHSLTSYTGSSEASSRLSVPDVDVLMELDVPPTMLTPQQLEIVKITWHLVLHDSSNICLNFFHQLQRRFPHIKRLQKNQVLTNSMPSLPSSVQLMTRNRSCSSEHKKQSQLPQQALKLACCIDNLIGSLLRRNALVEEKVICMLEEAGNTFKTFLGLSSLYSDSMTVREMSNAFSESLRLILVHNRVEGLEWNDEVSRAWAALFHTLLFYMDGLDDGSTWDA